eukprot:scaffold28779_cov66-Phaeocystis_antarctica.AAC.2
MPARLLVTPATQPPGRGQHSNGRRARTAHCRGVRSSMAARHCATRAGSPPHRCSCRPFRSAQATRWYYGHLGTVGDLAAGGPSRSARGRHRGRHSLPRSLSAPRLEPLTHIAQTACCRAHRAPVR